MFDRSLRLTIPNSRLVFEGSSPVRNENPLVGSNHTSSPPCTCVNSFKILPAPPFADGSKISDCPMHAMVSWVPPPMFETARPVGLHMPPGPRNEALEKS